MDKEQAAIERLKTASEMSLAVYGLPLVVTTSGGKDSSVCVELAKRAGIPFGVLHNHTTTIQRRTRRRRYILSVGGWRTVYYWDSSILTIWRD